MLCLTLAAGAMTACSPDEIAGLNEGEIAMASDYADMIKVTPNYETNEVVFSIDGAKNIYPIWYVTTPKGKTEKNLNPEWKKIYKPAGDYEVHVKIGNRNGISDGEVVKNFTLIKNLEKFSGFKYDAESNLWLTVDETNEFMTHFYYAPGWGQIDDPKLTKEGDTYTFELPAATTDQWQAQCPIKPNALHLTTDKTYDFSVIINSNNDIKGVTVKLTDVNSGDNFVFAERTDVKAGEDCVFYLSDVNNLSADADCELFFDFGGNPENTTVSVSRIVVKDHAIDDGTVLPKEEEDAITWDFEANLLKDMPVDIQYWYAPGWNQIDDPKCSASNGSYTWTLPAATTDQWQAQIGFHNTGVEISHEKSYDFRCVLTSNTDHPGFTIKLTQEDNDGIFLTEARHKLTAGEDIVIELGGLKLNSEKDITNLKIMLDAGGNAENAEITISEMHLQEHKGPRTVVWDLTGEKNLWLKGSHETISFHYAPGWNKIDDPKVSVSGNSYTIVLPAATTDQWQAQWHIATELTADDIKAGQLYDIRFTITSTKDHPGVTFKLTENGNDGNFLTEARNAVKADEETTFELKGLSLPLGDITNPNFKLALDFGGNPEGCEVTVSDIIIQAVQ